MFKMLQCGHSKSVYSWITTFAFGLPKTFPPTPYGFPFIFLNASIDFIFLTFGANIRVVEVKTKKAIPTNTTDKNAIKYFLILTALMKSTTLVFISPKTRLPRVRAKSAIRKFIKYVAKQSMHILFISYIETKAKVIEMTKAKSPSEYIYAFGVLKTSKNLKYL